MRRIFEKSLDFLYEYRTEHALKVCEYGTQ